MQVNQIILLFIFLTQTWAAVGQIAPSDTTSSKKEEVQVDHADLFTFTQSNGNTIQKLIGHVELSQDSVYMYCDSATIKNRNDVTATSRVIIQQGDSLSVFSDSLVYDGTIRVADLYGEVILVNGEQRLFTDTLNYNLNTKVATYFNGATLTNETSQLTSKVGYYYVEEQVAYFKDSVIVVDSSFLLKADTLKFNTQTKVVEFLGPTLIKNDSIQVYCESGFYDTENNIAEFTKNAQFQKNQQQARGNIIRYDGLRNEYLLIGNAKFREEDQMANADTIRYDEANDQTFLLGNASYADKDQKIVAQSITYNAKSESYTTTGRSTISNPPQILTANKIDYREDTGLGLAVGSVIWQDTSADLSIYCNIANYNRNTDYLKAFGGDQGRPLLVSLIDEDSLFLSADTLLSLKLDSLDSDSSRALIGYQDVRVYKSDLQAVCDSMVYTSSDSLFYFYKEPIMWSDTSQFSADSIKMQMNNNQIDKIYLNSNALIINSPDELFFNQVKGRNITAAFQDSNLRTMKVEGNAESIYYALDEEKAYVGVNKTICSEMLLYFGDNQVDKIKFFAEPKANLLPMSQTNHEEIKLKGFFWETKLRPMNVDDLFPEIPSNNNDRFPNFLDSIQNNPQPLQPLSHMYSKRFSEK